METKKAKVIMLPTKDKNQDWSILKSLKLNNLSYYHISSLSLINDKTIQRQHLYIITDDKIKEGDWCYDEYNNTVFQNNCKGTPGASKKIIATTDKSLLVNPHSKDGMLMYNCLPQPSQVFIEKYCKVGGIDEVLVEYVTNYVEWKHSDKDKLSDTSKLKIDSHNTITIHPIKPKLYTKEELEKVCRDLLHVNERVTQNTLKAWLNENL